jgi:hypothetical protein
MRILTIGFLAFLATGCISIAEIATQPLPKKAYFEETQASYTSDIRFGLVEEAAEHVEPALLAEFTATASRLSDIRFTGAWVEHIEIDPLRIEALAVVRFKGYWLSSPFEREIRITQRWRRTPPSQQWYVTPDLDALIDAAPPVSAGPR